MAGELDTTTGKPLIPDQEGRKGKVKPKGNLPGAKTVKAKGKK